MPPYMSYLSWPNSSPHHIHGSGSRFEEVCGVLNGWDIAQDTFPDVL